MIADWFDLNAHYYETRAVKMKLLGTQILIDQQWTSEIFRDLR